MTPAAADESGSMARQGTPPAAAPVNASANSSSGSGRRQTLPTVPTAAAVEQGAAKWLEFAPTSPQRRASFVSEPRALEGNPFEIFREPARADPVLGTQSFYEAGAAYAVKDSSGAAAGAQAQQPPAALLRTSMSLGQSASAPRLPAGGPIIGGSSTSPSPPPLGASRAASTGSLHNAGEVNSKPRPEPLPISSGNPFYEAPLSPIRYNKPIAKVELSPSSHALFAQAFSELDPLKRAESPTARIPLEQLSEYRARQQQQQQQQLLLQQQVQQQQQVAADQGWWEQGQQQQGFAATGGATASLNASFGVMSLGGHQQQAAAPALPQSLWADFSAFGAPAGPPTPAVAALSADEDGFDLLVGVGAGAAAAPAATGDAGSLFDPVRQKSLADASFDLGVVAYFPEEDEELDPSQSSQQHPAAGGEEGEHHDEDIDGSWGGGHAEFEIQDDHLVPEERERAGSAASGLLYEVAFAAPTQFGMLLERKDEWTRGTVQRRERTVVTLVVEGGEAEAKGVSTGSMIVSINGEDVTALTYKETLERIKSPVRPMRVMFEREPQQKEEVLQGYYFVSKGPFFSNPTSMDKWKRKYVVLGGPIAKKNVLQIYDSKRAYHNTVVALFQRKRPQHRVKTYALTYAFKLSPLQERKMEGHTAPLKFFAFMTPGARFKSIRVASETKKSVQALHERFGRFAGKR